MAINYSKPTVRAAWAQAAVNPTDIIDPGDPYIAAGWLESTTPPIRQYANWELNYVASAVRYFSQKGIVDWDSLETYQGGPESAGVSSAFVQYLGTVYMCIVPNTIGGQPPVLNTTNWAVAFVTPSALSGALTTTEAILNSAIAFNLTEAEAYTNSQIAALEVTQTPGTTNNELATTAFVNPNTSLGPSGFRANPDGTAEQWGTVSCANVFIPYPNQSLFTAAWGVNITPFGASTTATAQCASFTKAGFTPGGGNYTAFVRAWGRWA
jgi:hypothetical protein